MTEGDTQLHKGKKSKQGLYEGYYVFARHRPSPPPPRAESTAPQAPMPGLSFPPLEKKQFEKEFEAWEF